MAEDTSALIFDGYRPWRSDVAMPVPHGMQAMTCVWVKNTLIANAKSVYNVRAKLDYLYNGTDEFTLQTAAWWYEPYGPAPIEHRLMAIDLGPDESQAIPVYMQPVGVIQLNPPWPQSASDGAGTRSLRPGKWTARLTITADHVQPIIGEIDFIVFQKPGSERFSVMSSPEDVRLPLGVHPTNTATEPSKFRQFGFAGLCFLVAFICWAVQKGDAAVNPSLSWLNGLFWYGIATVSGILGVWLWKHTAARHIGIRIILTIAILALMGWQSWGPVMQERQRERQVTPSKPAPIAAVIPAPLPTSAPQQRSAAKPTKPLPMVAFLYRDHMLQIHNLENSEIALCGTKLDKGPRSFDGNPISIAKEPFFYYIHTESFETEMLEKFRDGQVLIVPYYLYFKDLSGRKFTAKCGFRTTISNKTVNVETQNLGTKAGWVEF